MCVRAMSVSKISRKSPLSSSPILIACMEPVLYDKVYSLAPASLHAEIPQTFFAPELFLCRESGRDHANQLFAPWDAKELFSWSNNVFAQSTQEVNWLCWTRQNFEASIIVLHWLTSKGV